MILHFSNLLYILLILYSNVTLSEKLIENLWEKKQFAQIHLVIMISLYIMTAMENSIIF